MADYMLDPPDDKVQAIYDRLESRLYRNPVWVRQVFGNAWGGNFTERMADVFAAHQGKPTLAAELEAVCEKAITEWLDETAYACGSLGEAEELADGYRKVVA